MTVEEIMTKHVISVSPDTSVGAVAELLFDGNLTGVPVVDHDRYVVGIVTEYDLVSKHEHFHIPTYAKVLGQMQTSKNDVHTQAHMSNVQSLTAGDIMTHDVVTLREFDDVSKAASIFSLQRINPLPVLDSNRKLTGIVSRSDLVKLLKNP